MATRFGFASLLFSISLGAQASTWTMAELPGEIQGCLANGTCLLGTQSTAEFGNASVFDLAWNPHNGQPATVQQLIRYELAPPSANDHSRWAVYEEDANDFSHTALGGSAWLAADNTYDMASDRHTFTLYLDRVSPAAENLWLWQEHPSTKIISISTAELLAGHGGYRMDYADDYTSAGDLLLHAQEGDAGYPYLSCIECSVGIDFNLIGLEYANFGSVAALTINPEDTRTLLYGEWLYQHEGSYYGSIAQSLYVATVPEPSAWMMMLVGVGIVGWAVSERKAKDS